MVWSDTENIAWKTEVPGLGWSSPAVADGIVYLTTAVTNGSEISLRALAIDALTGQTIWDREIRKLDSVPAIHSKNSHASPTPIVNVIDGKAQLLAPGPDHFAAYDLANGEELWHVRAPGWSVVPQVVSGERA